MTLRLNGSSSGFTELDAPAAAGSNTITLPTSNGSAEQFLKNSGTAGELEFSSMVEDSSGRLLVGTSTARSAGDVTASLQVEGTGFATSSLNLISNAGASAGNVAHISLAKSRGTSDGSNTVVASGDNLGTIQFCGADGTDLNSVAASFAAAVDDTPGGNDMPGRLVFSTTADSASSPTERMRIDKNGFQASTSANHGIEMGITAGSSSLNTIFRGRFGATAGSFATGTISFNVFANGDVTNTNNSYTAISDITLKENIVPASSQWDNIKDIEVVNYNFIEFF